ncbi:proprotein convertase subtilisin/kexin type 5 [Synchiropus picturatus]
MTANPPDQSCTSVEWIQQQVVLRRSKRTSTFSPKQGPRHLTARVQFGDPLRNTSWYISHMNISGAWRRGYTGSGVVVSVLGDGIEREHPDLKPNYDVRASSDVKGQERSPSRKDSKATKDLRTEQCAGVITAAAKSSHSCSIGVSFQARIGGVNTLRELTDATEAASLSFRPQYIDIFLADWGPADDGATVDGPGPLARLALMNSIMTGRQGKGSIFVWGSGSGGQNGDHCSCDGYSSSIYTISVSSSTWRGGPPEYLERCASTLATAVETEEVLTLGQNQTCSRAKCGPSQSPAVVAGVIALALEANPLLTWRDIQHIIVRASTPRHLLASDWHINGAGHKVSHVYGFGLLDAEMMVREAEQWKNVPQQHVCVQENPIRTSRTIHPGTALTSAIETTGCSTESQQHVVYVEHVIVRVSIVCSRRGDLSLTLTSPSGTVSELLANRPHDNSTEGFHHWEFMTTHCWGEQAAGEWTLKILDGPSHRRRKSDRGLLKEWSLVIYGTAEKPYPKYHRSARSAEMLVDSNDSTEEYSGPCDPECSEDGCEGPGPEQCVTCLHLFLKFKNNTRICVSKCPRGYWGDRRRCKRCYSSCESCSGSRRDQCTACISGYHLTEGTNTCTAFCGDGFYLDHDTNMCRRCSESCLRCTSSSVCIECRPDMSLQGNRCRQSCTPGFYHDQQEAQCRPCHEACATCAGAGAEACTLCAEGYLIEEWRCVPSCSAAFYATEPSPEIADRQGICRRCDASCLTCVGPSRQNCSSCSSGHRLENGVCVVSSLCADGEFQDSSGKCHACDATCLKCRGPQDGDCISCVASRALDQGRCVLECDKVKYQSGGQCHLCDHTCATCVDAGSSNCSSCDTDKFGMERYLLDGQCLDSCPEAFFHTQDGRCQRCPDHCRLCSSSRRCLKCQSSYYLFDGVCLQLECGEGEVEDPDYHDCMPCEEGCKQCVLYNPRHCQSCMEGYYNFQDACYRDCPAKTFSVEDQMTCIPCDDTCVSCDQNKCYWCETDLFLSEGSCVSVCPDGFYGDEDSNNCEECDADCLTCDGPNLSNCLTCEDGKVLQMGQCVSDHEVCPIRTFRTVAGSCEDCHPSCESCSGEEKNQCTACAKGRFLTEQRTCVSKCPGGFFASRLSSVCELCPAGCLQCADAQHCTRCQSTRKAPLFLQDGECVQQCDSGFYPVGPICRSCAAGCVSCWRNASHCLSCEEHLFLHKHQCVDECPRGHTVRDGECQRCPTSCHDCNPLGQCTGCEDYHFLHDGLCVLDCPERFYEDKELRECLHCHPDCDLCDGPNSNDCDACVDPEATLHNGACVAFCPPHSFRDAITSECKDCDASCLTCFGPLPASCSSCREDHELDGHGHCVPSDSECTPHQYPDQDGDCHPCHKFCHRCFGPGKSQCLSCNQRHFLLNGTCVDKCPTGFYQDAAGLRCESCHPSCESCGGMHSHECLTCKDDLFREGKECVEICQHGHYGNRASRMCEKCDPSCSECMEGGDDSCLTCALGLIYLRKEGRCLPSCPLGYFHDAAHRTCQPCHASCRSCSGSRAQSCDSCQPGSRLSDGMCLSLCDEGKMSACLRCKLLPSLCFIPHQSAGHSCEECDVSCEECRGPGPTNCTACPLPAILEAGGRCLLCCHLDDQATVQPEDCCNCSRTRGECILSTNLAFRNKEEEEIRGNLTVFIIACVLLVLVLVAIVFIIRHSRSKRAPPDIPPRGYEKLGSGGGGFGGFSSASNTSYSGHASSSAGHFQESQLVDLRERRAGSKDEDDDDDDDDEDIVYMGQDGTVYRKFRYGQLADDNEDELEYDDESYTYR